MGMCIAVSSQLIVQFRFRIRGTFIGQPLRLVISSSSSSSFVASRRRAPRPGKSHIQFNITTTVIINNSYHLSLRCHLTIIVVVILAVIFTETCMFMDSFIMLIEVNSSTPRQMCCKIHNVLELIFLVFRSHI